MLRRILTSRFLAGAALTAGVFGFFTFVEDMRVGTLAGAFFAAGMLAHWMIEP